MPQHILPLLFMLWKGVAQNRVQAHNTHKKCISIFFSSTWFCLSVDTSDKTKHNRGRVIFFWPQTLKVDATVKF